MNGEVRYDRKTLEQYLRQPCDLHENISIYGVGGIAEMSAGLCFGPGTGLEPAYYIDDTPEKHGSVFCGRPVINFEEARTHCKDVTILLCCGSVHVRKTMERTLREHPIQGANFSTLDEYIFCNHAGEVLAAYDLLEDDVSRETYANLVLVRLGKDNIRFVHTHEYFELPEFAHPDPSEVFVDFGAYTGDTIQDYLAAKNGMCQKIYAFEPFEDNFEKLRERKEQLTRKWHLNADQIELVPAAVSNKTGKVLVKYRHEDVPTNYSLRGAESAGEGTLTYSIDDYFDRQRVSFLKADIQGLEWNMLAGGEAVIRRDHPKLAVCIYHTPCDMYRIALKLKELCPDYKFAVRQYHEQDYDTVLYAY